MRIAKTLSVILLIFVACSLARAGVAAWSIFAPQGLAASMKPRHISETMDKTRLKETLSPQAYACTQENGTERPFQNAYWDNKSPGIYVDAVGGAPLFSSLDKYDSRTGWPSFSQPIQEPEQSDIKPRTDAATQPLRMLADHTLGATRTEVRSRAADSHLGHVFDDGPAPSHQRFCINSASLRFVPLADMQKEGLGRFLFRFADSQHWQVITLGAGCFWGVEELFLEQPGIIETQVGYAGGQRHGVTYEQVCTGATGHAEAVQILFDPKKISLQKLLTFFFRMHDPTTPNRQANDKGTQYRSVIFAHDAEQKKVAQDLVGQIAAAHAFASPIITEIVPYTFFVRAEPMHQRYLQAHPNGYRCHVVRDMPL